MDIILALDNDQAGRNATYRTLLKAINDPAFDIGPVDINLAEMSPAAYHEYMLHGRPLWIELLMEEERLDNLTEWSRDDMLKWAYLFVGFAMFEPTKPVIPDGKMKWVEALK